MSKKISLSHSWFLFLILHLVKDKAAVLLELEKLTTMKEELTEEVARLHKLLEQERSSTKVISSSTISESHNNLNAKHKDKVINLRRFMYKSLRT